MTNERRIAIEKQIARATIKALLAAGYIVTMNDGEEDTVEQSTDAAAIYAAMMTTDEDYLIAHTVTGQRVGYIYFVYGNDGYDVISDYTMSLETVMNSVNELADELERRA